MISFSGIDCSGKSTQIQLLHDELMKKGIKHQIVWSRGGYTPGIERVKKLFRKNANGNMAEILTYSTAVNSDNKKRRLLFFASLVDLWIYYSIVLRVKEIFRGLIICDRYIWDTYIDFMLKYPDLFNEKGFCWRAILHTMLKPAYSFVLYISADESMRRSELKEEPFPEPVEKRRQRIEMYNSEMVNERWNHPIDASVSILDVYLEIVRTLGELGRL